MLKQLEMSNNEKLSPGIEAGREGTILVPSTESSGYGKELPDKSYGQGGTQLVPEWWGLVGEQAGEKHPHFSLSLPPDLLPLFFISWTLQGTGAQGI